MDFGNPELNRQAAAYQQVWVHEMQAGLERLSTRGSPEIVVKAVRDIVADVRAEGPKPVK